MVDSVSAAAAGSVARTQSTALQSSIVGLKSNAQATQAIINQLQQTVDQGKITTSQNVTKSIAQSNSPLPRGSLIDITA